MNTKHTQEIKDQLEQLIDSYTLAEILTLLTEVCHEKADHILSNWNDENLAHCWTDAARQIDNVATEV